MEIFSDTHKATVGDNGLLTVWQLAPRELRVTRSTPEGGVDVTMMNSTNAPPSEQKMLEALNRMPYFYAGYLGESNWTCDIDAGFQRWRGEQPTRIITKALTQCGFDAAARKKILAEARKHKCQYVPRCY